MRIQTCYGLVTSALALAGCFPTTDTYRPSITGQVVDDSHAPMAGVNVEACSDSSWGDLRGCPRRETATTTADGKFELHEVKESTLATFGEAPLPRTVVSVCMPDGRIGGAWVDGHEPVSISIPVGAPEALAPTRGGHGVSHGSGHAKEEVAKRCADQKDGPPKTGDSATRGDASTAKP